MLLLNLILLNVHKITNNIAAVFYFIIMQIVVNSHNLLLI